MYAIIYMTVAECKEKWRNLRYSLLRSLKPNADGTSKKKYYLHKEMEFLIPFMKSKATGFITHFEEETDDEIPHDLSHDMASPQQQLFEYEFLNSEPTAKRKRNLQIDPFNHIQTHYDSDSRKQFMLGLMPEVNALTEDQMKVFRRKILGLLDNITEGSAEGESVSRNVKRRVKSEPAENDKDNEVYTITAE